MQIKFYKISPVLRIPFYRVKVINKIYGRKGKIFKILNHRKKCIKYRTFNPLYQCKMKYIYIVIDKTESTFDMI